MQVSDFPLAVTLATLGYSLESIDRSNAQRFQFCFKLEEGIDQVVQAFWCGEIRLEPKALFFNHKLLKSRLFNAP